ncbi:hypothetical protein KKI24_00970 [bacterium]|nr:hypothetical protein [bacterium]
MKAKGHQPIQRIKDKQSGEYLYAGRFYFNEKFPEVKFPIKRRLIYESDLDFKQTNMPPVGNNEA